MDTYITIIVVQAILELILLITFFVMANNVASIKKMLTGSSDKEAWENPSFFDVVDEEIVIGNNAKAEEMLKRARYRYLNSVSVQEKFSDYNEDREWTLNEEAYMEFVKEIDKRLENKSV